MSADRARKTTLTEWFVANRTIALAQETTYLDFPSKFVWKDKEWTLRKRGMCIGRLYFVSPKAGERYFLRTLLTTVKGPTSFFNLRTFEGIEYDTSCVARGLYESDEKWQKCLREASVI